MSDIITHLKPNQVFVFGSNQTGFSCSGSAGTAIRGYVNSRLPWRNDPWVLRAMRAPVGDPARIGCWGVFGVARGFSRGHSGMSYAIETIRHPGQKRSTPLREIEDQIVELCTFCDEHPEWEFLFTAIGSALAGWTEDEMSDTLLAALTVYQIRTGSGKPANLVIPHDLYGWEWPDEIASKPSNSVENN